MTAPAAPRPVDVHALPAMLNALRLPSFQRHWQVLAERADAEGWPASRFLAKSFSADTEVRFNTVNAGPLKTSASAGIPGYLDNYLFAEKLTLRRRALSTQVVADAAVWLLSPRSSGVNAQGIVVDAGMGWNYFDESVVRAATRLG